MKIKKTKKEDWKVKELEKCIDKTIYPDKILKKNFLENGKYPVVSQESDFINGYFNDEDKVFKIIKPVTIFGDHTKILKYIDFDFVLGADGVKILQQKDFLNSKYFYYFLQNIDLKDLGYARHFKLLKEIKVSFPKSIDEQKRIVKILDGVFADIEEARENAEKNLENAKELFESYLESIFNNNEKLKNKNEEWEESALGGITDLMYGYTEKAKPTGDLRFVRITDTDDVGFLKQSGKMYVDIFSNFKKYLLADSDLLMARTGASAGNVMLYSDLEKSIFASYLIRIKFRENILTKLYWYFSKSKSYWEQVNELSAGSAQPQFNGGALKQIIFKFPKSLKTQKQIVKKLDELSGEMGKYEAILLRKIADLDELKKSVLEKAFDGKL